MPVGLLSLATINILSHQKLISLRPYMMVVNLIFGAVLTTPEVVTQLIMSALLQLLCEFSILITRIIGRDGHGNTHKPKRLRQDGTILWRGWKGSDLNKFNSDDG
jgi:Sec-independent protein secretion pathway component TatC